MDLEIKKQRSQSIVFNDSKFYKVNDQYFTWTNSKNFTDLNFINDLSIINEIYSLHTTGLHIYFEPTIDETLEQIPDEYFKENEILYYTVEPYSIHVNLINSPSDNKQRGIIYLFDKTESKIEGQKTIDFFKSINDKQTRDLIKVENQISDHIIHYNKIKSCVYNNNKDDIKKIKSPIEQSKILIKKTDQYMAQKKMFCVKECLLCRTIERFN